MPNNYMHTINLYPKYRGSELFSGKLVHASNTLCNDLFLAFGSSLPLHWSRINDLTRILDVEVLHEDFLTLSPVDPSYSKVTFSCVSFLV